MQSGYEDTIRKTIRPYRITWPYFVLRPTLWQGVSYWSIDKNISYALTLTADSFCGPAGQIRPSEVFRFQLEV